MKQTATMGKNQTGTASSEGRCEAMTSGMERFAPTSHGAGSAAGTVRVAYAKEGSADGQRGVGSVPPPAELKGIAKTALKAARGDKPTLLMDKLGERLAFERTGTRLYEALVSKHEAYGSYDGGPSRRDILDIMNEEHEHFLLLEQTIEEMSGDPTAVTPSADVAATAAEGVMRVVTDPRTTLVQSLEAILIAELTDNDSWASLIELARDGGESEVAQRFEAARRTEEEHLYKVRSWLQAGYGVGARAAE